MAKYGVHTSVKELLENENTKAVLEEVLPKLVNGPQAAMFSSMPMTLEQIITFSGGKIPQDKVDLVKEKLEAIED